MEGFRFTTPIEVRFADVDGMAHVNNAVFATYFEEARATFAREAMGLATVDDFDYLVARIEIDYRRPLLYGQALRAALRVAGVGASSFTFEYKLLADGDVIAEGKTVQVFYDYATGNKKPMPAAFREKVLPFSAPGVL